MCSRPLWLCTLHCRPYSRSCNLDLPCRNGIAFVSIEGRVLHSGRPFRDALSTSFLLVILAELDPDKFVELNIEAIGLLLFFLWYFVIKGRCEVLLVLIPRCIFCAPYHLKCEALFYLSSRLNLYVGQYVRVIQFTPSEQVGKREIGELRSFF